MSVDDFEYRFDSLSNAGKNGPAFELISSSCGGSENYYAALESIADRISCCASGVN